MAQNYKLPSHTNNRFEGFSGKQLAKQEIRNKKEGEKAKKELLKSHIKKQTKATQKRMKSSLKKSKRLLRNKSLVPRWLVWWKRKKAFSQRKENKYCTIHTRWEVIKAMYNGKEYLYWVSNHKKG